jgi:hypothetical protein
MEMADMPWLVPSSESTLSNEGRFIVLVKFAIEGVEGVNEFIEMVRVKGVTEGW